MDDAQAMPGRSWRPRISLLSALLSMTIVGLAIVVIQLWYKVDPLRIEVRKLREQLGILTIDNPSLIQAIGVPSDVEDVLKWRVYIPSGKTATMRAKFGDISRTGYPQGEFQTLLKEGEQLIAIRTTKREPTGLSVVADIHAPQSNSMITVGFTPDDVSGMFQSDRVSSTRVEMDGAGKLLLVRTRFAPPGQSQSIAKDAPLPGFIIWLDGQ